MSDRGDGLRVAVVGATGAVGGEILRVLRERRFPVAELVPLATTRSAGAAVAWGEERLQVAEAVPSSFDGIDLAFFCATTDASRQLAPEAARRGAVVIDKSNAFRMDDNVPLVVPEVNPGAAFSHRGIIASPNCSTIQLVVPLAPIHRRVRVARVIVSSYQSVSGAGLDAVGELVREVQAFVRAGCPVPPPPDFVSPEKVFSRPIAFNCLPQIDEFDDAGSTGEETKLLRETRRILDCPGLPLAATCVRVPVLVGHALAVNIDTDPPLDPDAARRLLEASPGVRVIDDPPRGQYPLPLDVAGRDEVFVGRIRRDPSAQNGLMMWIVADNLRKGAATNAVQIAELLRDAGRLPKRGA